MKVSEANLKVVGSLCLLGARGRAFEVRCHEYIPKNEGADELSF